jgi:hypothetical protein
MERIRGIVAAGLAATLLPAAAAGQDARRGDAPTAREHCADACRAAEAACYDACGDEAEHACLDDCIGKADACFDRCEAQGAEADRGREQ